MDLKNFAKLLACILIPFIAAFVGSVFTFPAIASWYVSLNKPFFSPPNWVFAPAWAILYFLMGISLYLVLQKSSETKKAEKGIFIFASQLSLNVLWSIVFFGLQNPLCAFVEIAFLWFFVGLTVKEFFKISKKAAWLLVPYWIWVSFATILNLSIVLLN